MSSSPTSISAKRRMKGGVCSCFHVTASYGLTEFGWRQRAHSPFANCWWHFFWFFNFFPPPPSSLSSLLAQLTVSSRSLDSAHLQTSPWRTTKPLSHSCTTSRPVSSASPWLGLLLNLRAHCELSQMLCWIFKS
jgi:hypothetical protein